MRKSSQFIGAGVTLLLIALVGGGRLFSLVVRDGHPVLISLTVSMALSLPISLLGYFGVYLVLAEGDIARKLNYIKLLFPLIIISALFSSYILNNYRLGAEYHFNIYLLLSILLFFNFVIADRLGQGGRVYTLDFEETPPAFYYRRAPIKRFLLTIFRLAPYPRPLALYRVGSPGDHSPIIVTGNYELTVRRVAAALKGLDCYLLIVNSRGINIWCASLAGHLGTTDLLEAIRITHLKSKTAMRQLILPQLSAASIDREELLQKSGFTALFGPVEINDLRDYLEERDSDSCRQVKFGLWRRLEMGLGAPLISVIILFLIYNFLGLSRLITVIPAIYIFSLLGAALYPHRPFKNSYIWALFYGAAIYIVTAAFHSRFAPQLIWQESFPLEPLLIAIFSAYLVVEFAGWSPLIKFGFLPYKKSTPMVDYERCTGCTHCCRVCPRGVFKMVEGKAQVTAADRCIHCKACLKQCRAAAVKFIE